MTAPSCGAGRRGAQQVPPRLCVSDGARKTTGSFLFCWGTGVAPFGERCVRMLGVVEVAAVVVVVKR